MKSPTSMSIDSNTAIPIPSLGKSSDRNVEKNPCHLRDISPMTNAMIVATPLLWPIMFVAVRTPNTIANTSRNGRT